MEEFFKVEHNIMMNLVHCQPVQTNSRARPLGTIQISLRFVVEGWCVIQIPRTERYQLGCYVPLCNAPFRSRFIAHIRLESPKAPGVHTYTSCCALCTRCTTKWTMLVKNPGGNTCSSLHKVIQTYASKKCRHLHKRFNHFICQ